MKITPLDLEPTDSECIFSLDVETDELDVSKCNVLSVGVTPVGDPPNNFYVELKTPRPPFVGQGNNSKALEICHKGFSWQLTDPTEEYEDTPAWYDEFYGRTITYGTKPLLAFGSLSDWVLLVAKGRYPVMLTNPGAFDAAIIETWFRKFPLANPFTRSLCLRTLLWAYYRGQRPLVSISTKRLSEDAAGGVVNHAAHNALADAKFQAVVYNNITGQRAAAK